MTFTTEQQYATPKKKVERAMVVEATRSWMALDVGFSHASHALAIVAMQSTLSDGTMCTTS